MHTAVHDSIALQVLGSNRQLAAHLVLGRERDGDAHRVEPAFGHRLQPFGEVEAHTQNRSGEKQGAGLHVRLLVSTFAVLPPPTPGVGFGKGGPRGSLPPELPAGKRGGWHHDSVYPSFRLTSFAPRALNFVTECTSRLTTKLLARCHPDMSPCVAHPNRPPPSSNRRARWGGCWRSRGSWSSTADLAEFRARPVKAPRRPAVPWLGSCPTPIEPPPTRISPSPCRRGWARPETSWS